MLTISIRGRTSSKTVPTTLPTSIFSAANNKGEMNLYGMCDLFTSHRIFLYSVYGSHLDGRLDRTIRFYLEALFLLSPGAHWHDDLTTIDCARAYLQPKRENYRGNILELLTVASYLAHNRTQARLRREFIGESVPIERRQSVEFRKHSVGYTVSRRPSWRLNFQSIKSKSRK
jgi:hypothetical protein